MYHLILNDPMSRLAINLHLIPGRQLWDGDAINGVLFFGSKGMAGMLSGLGTACSEDSVFQNKGRSSPKGHHTRSQQQAAEGANPDTRHVQRVYFFTKSLRPAHPAPSTALAAQCSISQSAVRHCDKIWRGFARRRRS